MQIENGASRRRWIPFTARAARQFEWCAMLKLPRVLAMHDKLTTDDIDAQYRAAAAFCETRSTPSEHAAGDQYIERFDAYLYIAAQYRSSAGRPPVSRPGQFAAAPLHKQLACSND